MEHYERIAAKIDLDAIAFNLQQMHDKIKKDTKIMAVIKTDGYGHGAVPIAKMCEELAYIKGYAVATAQEAYQLRNYGIHKMILILGYTFESEYEQMIREDIRPSVFTLEMAEAFSKAAVKIGKTANIHIKMDTGMRRIGFEPTDETIAIIQKIAALPGIHIEGIFTHMAKADETDKTSAREQIRKFMDFTNRLSQAGITPDIRHCSNSAGILELPEANFDMVRAGISLYGLYPSNEVNPESARLEPAMELKSCVVYVKDVEKGEGVSYGWTYKAKKKIRVATIPAGYGDGYPRSLSNKGWVLIHGQKAPIIGRVCMDQFMVDVSAIEGVKTGDEVTLIGRDGKNCIHVEELGAFADRFNYEFVCDIGKRVPRIYYRNGKVIGYSDLLESRY